MSLYTKARKHIDMNRVKELHEEKIKRKKIVDEIREQIREELRNLNSPEFSNWREGIAEGMTSSGMFNTTLPATGDVDLSVTSMDASSFDTPEDVSFNSGTNSGFTGGFSAVDGIMNFSGDVDYNTNAATNALDLSQVDTVNISAIAGNNSNGGMLPSNDLKVAFLTDTEASDEFTVISKTSSSFSNANITIPQEFRKPGVNIFLFSTTGEFADQGQHLKPFTISISGLNHATMGSIGSGAFGTPGVNNIVAGILQRDATTANYRSMGVVLWDNIQLAKNGFSQGDNPNYGQPGETQYISLNNWDPAPVSGNRNQYGSSPDANGNDVEGVTDADYIYIGQHMFDTYKGSKLYGVSNISLKRRTPMNVFVSLDSPEATSFIRTDPTMQGLSAEERKKKLMDMLDAGDEYLLKYLGMVGSKARPSDTTMPDSWEQASGNPVTGGQPGYHSPGSTSPSGAARSDKNMTWDNHMKMYVPNIGIQDMLKKADAGSGDTEIAAAGVPRNTGGSSSGDPNNIQWPRDKYPNKKAPPGPGARTANVPGTKDYGNVAATYGGQSAADQKALDTWKKKNLIPGRGQNPYRPGTKQLYNPQTGMNLSAHYEPEGDVLSEKKKLKSVKDVTSKIPGYYDGKPAPLGFPMQEPPKMVNGFHPDLVDGKKIANRFNRLDPQSAKAMPPTGNPHIDKKVRAAAKKPK